MPYITNDGTLAIPFDSSPKYHWWAEGGQSVMDTIRDLGGSKSVMDRYDTTAPGDTMKMRKAAPAKQGPKADTAGIGAPVQQESAYNGLERIVSGGQVGVDQASLEAARICGIQRGGWATKGYRTLDGPNIELLRDTHNLVESESFDYKIRTYKNVETSDGTLRLAYDFTTTGEKCTMSAIVKYRKPYLDVQLENQLPAADIAEWVRDNKIKVLNIAGNAFGDKGQDIFDDIVDYLLEIFEACGFKPVMERPPRTNKPLF